jgi:hypothetical protein
MVPRGKFALGTVLHGAGEKICPKTVVQGNKENIFLWDIVK